MPEALDARGLFCPLPVLKTRRAIRRLAVGDLLTVLATDPASRIDMRHFCNTSGNELVDAREEAGVFTYVIRRTA
ncbi:MAG TPA: sulfurtransferase TusA family protein [Alphaproteobacteria bacterium]|nr:sulfurtransferase TusA family protein [Alphaproteobacteria bacterium]